MNSSPSSTSNAAAEIASILARLDACQLERNAATASALKLESQLAVAEIAIHTAQQEDRAPVWPPAQQEDLWPSRSTTTTPGPTAPVPRLSPDEMQALEAFLADVELVDG